MEKLLIDSSDFQKVMQCQLTTVSVMAGSSVLVNLLGIVLAFLMVHQMAKRLESLTESVMADSSVLVNLLGIALAFLMVHQMARRLESLMGIQPLRDL